MVLDGKTREMISLYQMAWLELCQQTLFRLPTARYIGEIPPKGIKMGLVGPWPGCHTTSQHTQKASSSIYRAARLIWTLPFPCLRWLALEPVILSSPIQRQPLQVAQG